jgi:hypothetical protein
VYFPEGQLGFRLEAKPSAPLVEVLKNTYRTTFISDFSTDQMFYFVLLQIFTK